MKKRIILISVIFILAATFGVLNYQKVFYSGDSGIRVITTLFPLYDMAKYIGGDKADVSLLLPPGVEPHSFEPKPSDVLKINSSDIFIYTGKFMEPWAQDVLAGVNNDNLVVIDASRGTAMIPAVFHDEDEPSGSLDPHIWLNFDNAKIMANNILAAFQQKDGANYDFYLQRTEEYKAKLNELDAEYRAGLLSCPTKKIIYGGHYAFGYLASRYGLEYLAAQGISPDTEPTAKDLVALVNQIRQDNIEYVFYEELSSSKIAETIAGETGAKLLFLNAAHNISREDLINDISFIDIMKENLVNLKIGLQCQ